MTSVRRLVLDVLKPHDPTLLAFTEQLTAVDCVEAVTTSLIELDSEVQNVEVTLEGEDLDFEAIEATIEEIGATVHSIDQAACGAYVAADGATWRDD